MPESIVWSNTIAIQLTSNPGWHTNAVTVAGNGTEGSAANQLYNPVGVYLDTARNIYVGDASNQRIQKWAPGAISGTTVAGTTGVYGSASNLFDYPQDVYIDHSGNIYIADDANNRIQKWAAGAASGITVAGNGIAGSSPSEINATYWTYVDASGNVYASDFYNSRIQKWAPGATSGITVAGTGIAGSAADQLNKQVGVTVDDTGNIYVSDYMNNRIQKWAPGATSGITIAGTGFAGSAANEFDGNWGIFLDGAGNLYIADDHNQRIQKWAPGATSGITIAGTGIEGSGASELDLPQGLYVDDSGNLYVADFYNARVQKFYDTIVNAFVPTASGYYTVVVTAFDGCSATEAFTVSPGPGSITGPSNVCQGSEISLTDTVGGGTWSASNSNATVSGGWVSGISSGVDTISYSLSSICGLLSATSVITINALPAISVSGSNTVCTGSTTTLTGMGGTNYIWLPSTGLSSTTGVSVVSSPSATTTYTVIGTDISGCSDTTIFPESIVPLPTSTVTFTGSVLATNTYPGATYQWYENGILISGATNSTYTPIDTGLYSVLVILTNSCIGSSNQYNVSDLAVANVAEISGLVNIFPNPAQSIIYIQSPIKVEARLTSIEGKLLIEQKEANEMNISHLASGVYLITIYDSQTHNKIKTEQIVKME